MKNQKKTIKKKITLWDVWTNNFYNAKRFFTSRGNLQTRTRLKDKWAKEFKKDIENFLQQWLKESL